MYFFLTLAIAIVIVTITQGIIKLYKSTEAEGGKIRKSLRLNIYSFVPVLTAFIIAAIPQVAHAADSSSTSGIGFIAAALSTGLACVGAGLAVAAVGSSALGAVSEDPKLLGKTLIFAGLAEGIAIYGLIISIMILGKL